MNPPNAPDPVQLLQLFQKVAPAWFLCQLCQKHGYPWRDDTYTVPVVVWLMMWQRLQTDRTLAGAVQHLFWGGCRELRSEDKREAEISSATGGYGVARQRLPIPIASEVSDRIVNELRAEMQEGWPGVQRPVFLIDGSTLQLPSREELRKRFPPGHNQHGENHWPVMHIAVMHDVYRSVFDFAAPRRQMQKFQNCSRSAPPHLPVAVPRPAPPAPVRSPLRCRTSLPN